VLPSPWVVQDGSRKVVEGQTVQVELRPEERFPDAYMRRPNQLFLDDEKIIIDLNPGGERITLPQPTSAKGDGKGEGKEGRHKLTMERKDIGRLHHTNALLRLDSSSRAPDSRRGHGGQLPGRMPRDQDPYAPG
jgi:hypothetical protein